MKFLAILILLAALFLLYRIAYPKQSVAKKDNEVRIKPPKSLPEVVGKSRFVLPARSQSAPTTAGSQVSEKEAEKPVTFAPEIEKNRSAVISKEQLDEVFSDEQNPEIFSLPLEPENENEDEIEDDIDLEIEEAEELNQALGQEAVYADGVDFDDLQTIAQVIKAQPSEVSEKTAETIRALEHTDMFELLVSSDDGKMNWIKSVIERNIQKTLPEAETEDSDKANYGGFISDFLE
jgi:hypothetical protein